VTITKCQAALRTLQAFPYFYPTCLCREPMSDPACNTFRDYLFDHPCSLLKVKGKFIHFMVNLITNKYAFSFVLSSHQVSIILLLFFTLKLLIFINHYTPSRPYKCVFRLAEHLNKLRNAEFYFENPNSLSIQSTTTDTELPGGIIIILESFVFLYISLE